MKNLFLVISCAIFFHSSALTQSSDTELQSKIQNIENRLFNRKQETQQLAVEIEEINKRLNTLSIPQRTIDSLTQLNNKLIEEVQANNKQLENLVAINNSASSFISNQTDWLAIILTIFGFLIGLLGVILGIYITRKENSMREILAQGEKNLEKQEKSQIEAERILDLVDGKLDLLFKQLREEELNYLFKKIIESPKQIRWAHARILTLEIPDSQYLKLKNLAFNWDSQEDTQDFVDYILSILVNRFPNEVACNPELGSILTRYWRRFVRGIHIQDLNKFLFKYVASIQQDPNPRLEREFALLLKPLEDFYNPRYFSELFFHEFTEKATRFQILELMKSNELFQMLMWYENLIVQEFKDNPDNSDEENQIIEEIEERRSSQDKK